MFGSKKGKMQVKIKRKNKRKKRVKKKKLKLINYFYMLLQTYFTYSNFLI